MNTFITLILIILLIFLYWKIEKVRFFFNLSLLFIVIYYELNFLYDLIQTSSNQFQNSCPNALSQLQLPFFELLSMFFFMAIGAIGTFFYYQRIEEDKVIFEKAKKTDRISFLFFLIIVCFSVFAFVIIVFKKLNLESLLGKFNLS